MHNTIIKDIYEILMNVHANNNNCKDETNNMRILVNVAHRSGQLAIQLKVKYISLESPCEYAHSEGMNLT